MKNKNIKFSIISVNFNGGDKIVKSIKSILYQNYPNIEIIIVDNGSKDNSIYKIKKIKSNKIKIFKLQKNFGFTTGSNYGIKKSSGKYFLLLNNDAYLQDKNFITSSINILKGTKKNIIGIFPKIIFNWEPLVINGTYVKWHYKQLWYDEYIGKIDFKTEKNNEEIFGAMFIAPIFKKKDWLKTGGFDNIFFTYGEDFDFSYRANIFGYKFLYCPTLIVKHDFRSSSKDNSNPLWSYFYFQRNYLYTIIKNYQFINLIKYFKYYSVNFRKSFKSSVKNKNKEIFKLHIKIIRDIIKNTPYLLKERVKIQKQRKVEDSQIWNYGFAINYNPFFYNNKVVVSLNNLFKD